MTKNKGLFVRLERLEGMATSSSTLSIWGGWNLFHDAELNPSPPSIPVTPTQYARWESFKNANPVEAWYTTRSDACHIVGVDDDTVDPRNIPDGFIPLPTIDILCGDDLFMITPDELDLLKSSNKARGLSFDDCAGLTIEKIEVIIGRKAARIRGGLYS